MNERARIDLVAPPGSVRIIAVTPLGQFTGRWETEEDFADFLPALDEPDAVKSFRFLTDTGAVVVPGDVLRQSILVVEKSGS